MATSSVPNTHVDASVIEAVSLNQNTQALVDFNNASAVHRDGSKTLTGNWNVGGFRLTNLQAPVSDNDAARLVDITAIGGSGHTHSSDAIVSEVLADARIPNLDASKITAGTLASARIPSLDTSKVTSGVFGTARIPNLDASKITAGTLNTARIPWTDTTAVSPASAAVHDLGSAARSWRRLYAGSAYNSSGVAVIDLNPSTLLGIWSTSSGFTVGDDLVVTADSTLNGTLTIPGAGTTTNSALPGWRQLGSADRSVNALVSSRQFKTDIVDAEVEESIRIVREQRVRNFRSLLEADDPSQVMLGMIAEETQLVTPDFTDEPDGDGNVAGIGYEGFIVPLIHTVQYLLERVAELEAS